MDLACGTVDVDIRYGSFLATSGAVIHHLLQGWIVVLAAPELVDGPHPIRQSVDLRYQTLIHAKINLFN